MAENNAFLVRESFGTYGLTGPPTFQAWDKLPKDNQEARFSEISLTGNRIAVGNNNEVRVYDTKTGDKVCVIQHRMLQARLSPNGSYLIEWDNPSQKVDNFKIWDLTQGNAEVKYALKLSKFPDVEFSGDEGLFARLSNNSVIFATVPDFHSTAKKTPEDAKISKFSLSPGTGPSHILCYIPSTKSGMPSNVRLHKYPDFDRAIASKSFFQSDRVEMKWNNKGTAVLLITMTDIDKTGKSYYGKTMLHYLDTKGTTATVQTHTDEPVIHAAEWSPTSNEFCVITGKMPKTRAALFNCKCEIVFDMGISARNAIHFNRQGNIVLLGGFGNLAHGDIEVWEIKNLKKKIAQLQAPATTQLDWLNDGIHFVTATTSPRMQIDNGFKVWDFSGKMVFEWNAQKHLFGFRTFYSQTPPAFPDARLQAIDWKLGNKVIPAREETKKAAAYVPPSLRKGNTGALAGKTASTAQKQTPALSETEKKIKATKKKLEQIQKLKEQQAEGKVLEKNQIDKISTEAALIKEIEALELGSS